MPTEKPAGNRWRMLRLARAIIASPSVPGACFVPLNLPLEQYFSQKKPVYRSSDSDLDSRQTKFLFKFSNTRDPCETMMSNKAAKAGGSSSSSYAAAADPADVTTQDDEAGKDHVSSQMSNSVCVCCYFVYHGACATSDNRC
jgi:hypothetical protein